LLGNVSITTTSLKLITLEEYTMAISQEDILEAVSNMSVMEIV